jgi:hypothetical protein
LERPDFSRIKLYRSASLRAIDTAITLLEILVGTCGYSYTEWVGPVYLERTQKDDFLALYAKMFPAVELRYAAQLPIRWMNDNLNIVFEC